MNDIPEFILKLKRPFVFEDHFKTLEKKYQDYYDKLLEEFKIDLNSEKSESIIKRCVNKGSSSKAEVPFYLEKAMENFQYDLHQKSYISTIEYKSKDITNSRYTEFNTWMELKIKLK